jgi:hypothetical protein
MDSNRQEGQTGMPKNEHWKEVVRDAFIDGRDDEAIDLMMSNIVTWIADVKSKRKPKQVKAPAFPDEIYIIWDDNDEDPDHRIMLVEESIDGISNGAAVGIFKLVAVKTKRVVDALE